MQEFNKGDVITLIYIDLLAPSPPVHQMIPCIRVLDS